LDGGGSAGATGGTARGAAGLVAREASVRRVSGVGACGATRLARGGSPAGGATTAAAGPVVWSDTGASGDGLPQADSPTSSTRASSPAE